jgi:hypothetical protein
MFGSSITFSVPTRMCSLRVALALLVCLASAARCHTLPPLKMCFSDGVCVSNFTGLQSDAAQRTAVQACHTEYTQRVGANCGANASLLVSSSYLSAATMMWHWAAPGTPAQVDYGIHSQ